MAFDFASVTISFAASMQLLLFGWALKNASPETHHYIAASGWKMPTAGDLRYAHMLAIISLAVTFTVAAVDIGWWVIFAALVSPVVARALAPLGGALLRGRPRSILYFWVGAALVTMLNASVAATGLQGYGNAARYFFS